MNNRLNRALDALLNSPGDVLIAVDFDGTLSPIVGDPERAYAEPAAVDALALLGRRVGTVAVVTGRPVETALRLGQFEGRRGLENLRILGQYGVESWDARTGQATSTPPPASLRQVGADLPSVLAQQSLSEARVEDKGHALVVHTRELHDPKAAWETLQQPLVDLVTQHGLSVEPGRYVWEIRDGQVDKGVAMRRLIDETKAQVVVFLGDDLGDLPAFDAVDEHRERGGEGILVCSASTEQDALTERADIVVDGPLGVAVWLADLAAQL